MALFSLINAKAYCYYEKVGYNDDCENCIAMEQVGYIREWKNLFLTLTSLYNIEKRKGMWYTLDIVKK